MSNIDNVQLHLTMRVSGDALRELARDYGKDLDTMPDAEVELFAKFYAEGCPFLQEDDYDAVFINRR